MSDSFIEGGLFVLIVFLAIMAWASKPPSGDRTCWVAGNPGSYVCEER